MAKIKSRAAELLGAGLGGKVGGGGGGRREEEGSSCMLKILFSKTNRKTGHHDCIWHHNCTAGSFEILGANYCDSIILSIITVIVVLIISPSNL